MKKSLMRPCRPLRIACSMAYSSSFLNGKNFPNSRMMRLMMYRVRTVPPIPQTIIVTQKAELSMASPSLRKPLFCVEYDPLDSPK
jgi:hypothetical protein